MSFLLILLLYIVFTVLIAKYIGIGRQIGYEKSVFWSIMLSPIIGLIITLLSPRVSGNSI